MFRSQNNVIFPYSCRLSCVVCYGTNYGLSHPSFVDLPTHEENAKVTARYEKYKEMYTNCTVIDGNLEIVFLMFLPPSNLTFDLDFLRDIREVISRPALLNCR